MARRDEVDLHVRFLEGRAVEFSLRRAVSGRGGFGVLWWSSVAFACGAGAVLLASHKAPPEVARTATALAVGLAVLAAWSYRSWGAVVVSESMMVMPWQGVTLLQCRRSGATSRKVIDRSTLCGVAVNEAITFSNVVYSLVFMVDGQDDMVPAFETFRPRIAVLQEIYKETKSRLFPDDENDGGQMRLPKQVVAASSS